MIDFLGSQVAEATVIHVSVPSRLILYDIPTISENDRDFFVMITRMSFAEASCRLGVVSTTGEVRVMLVVAVYGVDCMTFVLQLLKELQAFKTVSRVACNDHPFL